MVPLEGTLNIDHRSLDHRAHVDLDGDLAPAFCGFCQLARLVFGLWCFLSLSWAAVACRSIAAGHGSIYGATLGIDRRPFLSGALPAGRRLLGAGLADARGGLSGEGGTVFPFFSFFFFSEHFYFGW